jgi:hypothetical protein
MSNQNIFSYIKSKTWPYIKGPLQHRAVEREAKQYLRLGIKSGISLVDIYNSNFVKLKLTERLRNRGLTIKKKSKPNLNIVYLSCMDYWERANIPSTLSKFGKVSIFNTDENGYRIREQIYPDNWKSERKILNKKILDFVSAKHKEQPVDIVISYLSGYHLLPETIHQINKLGIITTAFWLDDKLKFKGRFFDGEVWEGAASVCAAYDLNLTSAYNSIIKYFVEGGLAIFWPEGANPEHFKPMQEPFKYDVSFIGSKYGARVGYIEYLIKNGVNVATFGHGWPNGGISPDEMIQIYAQSRINLGFNGQGYSMKATHLKARDFEIPICGAVYLTTFDEDHHRVYEVDKDIFVYRNKKEMLEKIKMLLANDELCAQTRLGVHRKCMEQHTWEKRFDDLFMFIGLI